MSRAPLVPFPNLEVALQDGLIADFTELASRPDGQDRVGLRLLDRTLDQGEFYVRVGRVGGAGDLLTSRGAFDVDVYGTSYTATWDFAQRIHQWVIRYPRRIESNARFVVLDSVGVTMEPQEVPWSDPRVRRFMMSYNISARR